MRPLGRPALSAPRPEQRRRAGPGPSKTVYRLTRVWNKTWVRRATLVVAPALAIGLAGWQVATTLDLASVVRSQRAALVDAIAARPEFALRGVRVTGASAELAGTIRAAVGPTGAASTLTADVAAIRAELAAMPQVRRVDVQLGTDGILMISVIERHAEALWRDAEGQLWLAAHDGVTLGPAQARSDHPDLPVVLGADALGAIAEALDLFHAVPDLHPRLRAFIHVGGRRWDVALARDVRVLLPEEGAVAALRRVMAWHWGEDLLDRGVAVIDMRLAERPTIRMTPPATELIRLRDALGRQPGEDT